MLQSMLKVLSIDHPISILYTNVNDLSIASVIFGTAYIN